MINHYALTVLRALLVVEAAFVIDTFRLARVAKSTLLYRKVEPLATQRNVSRMSVHDSMFHSYFAYASIHIIALICL